MEQSKRNKIILYLLIFFSGAFFGFLISPVKGGLGNNSGNNTYNNFYRDEPEADVEDAEESVSEATDEHS